MRSAAARKRCSRGRGGFGVHFFNGLLGKNDIDRFKVIVPAQDILVAFNEVAQPLYDRLVANKRQVQTLSSARDTLLPRLISGQLRLREAEQQVEEALA